MGLSKPGEILMVTRSMIDEQYRGGNLSALLFLFSCNEGMKRGFKEALTIYTTPSTTKLHFKYPIPGSKTLAFYEQSFDKDGKVEFKRI